MDNTPSYELGDIMGVRVPQEALRRNAVVVELVDTADLKSAAFGHVGSSPTVGTFDMLMR